MDWLILIYLSPLILIPIVVLCGFVGCASLEGLTGGGEDIPLPTRYPPPPTNLRATLVTSDHVTLEWDWKWDYINPLIKPEFSVERFISGMTVVSPPLVPRVTVLTYPDQKLDPGTIYIYQVTAIVTGKSSSPSDQLTVSTLPAATPPPPATATWKTIYDIKPSLDDDNGGFGWNGHCLVQRINKERFDSTAGAATATKVKITLRGSTVAKAKLVIDQVSISQVATAGPGNPTPNPWDSAGDLTEVKFGNVSGVTLDAGGEMTSDETSYPLHPDKDLLIAFNIDPSHGVAGWESVTGPTLFHKEPVGGIPATEAVKSDRSDGYKTRDNAVYLVEKIEIM